jgi:membrane-bound metal-dependent hydrolase YbcI (DUF457 family)
MNTQTHILMGAALFGRPLPRLAVAGALGGVVPDLPMYAIIIGLRASGHPLDEIFGRIYWEHWWQVANAIGHSFLLWGVLAAVTAAPALRDTASKAAPVFALSGSAIVHSVIDFLCHRDDAHMHFWPLTEWRFRSPVSYWDPQHFGQWFGLFEAMIGIALVVILWRRYANRLLRGLLALCLAAYVAVPAFFIFSQA